MTNILGHFPGKWETFFHFFPVLLAASLGELSAERERMAKGEETKAVAVSKEQEFLGSINDKYTGTFSWKMGNVLPFFPDLLTASSGELSADERERTAKWEETKASG